MCHSALEPLRQKGLDNGPRAGAGGEGCRELREGRRLRGTGWGQGEGLRRERGANRLGACVWDWRCEEGMSARALQRTGAGETKENWIWGVHTEGWSQKPI